MKKTLAFTTTLLMIGLIANTAFAWGPGRGQGFNRDCPNYNSQGYKGQNSADKLTQEQQDQLSALHQKFIDETYETRTAKFSKAQELRMLMQTSQPDKDKLYELINEIANIDKQLKIKELDYRLESKKIAPELTKASHGMFGRGHGMWSNGKGQDNWHGQGRRCGNY